MRPALTSSSSRRAGKLHPAAEGRAIDKRELRLGVLQVKDIQAAQPQVAEAPGDLLTEKIRSHAVDAAGKVIWLGDARRDELIVNVAPRGVGCDDLVRNKPGLAGYDELVALCVAAGDQLVQGPSQDNLAALAAVGERNVEMVAPCLHRGLDRCAIGRVHFVGRGAGRQPKTDRGHHQALEDAKMIAGRCGRRPEVLSCGEAGSACGGRVALESHQPALAALIFASFFWRSSAFREIRLKVPERPIAFLTSRIVSPAISR